MALVITRHEDERIRLEWQGTGTFVWLTVARLTSGNVKLLLDAPDGVLISREEILPPAQRYDATMTQRKRSES